MPAAAAMSRLQAPPLPALPPAPLRRERASGSKWVQLVAGARPSAFWASNLLFDLASFSASLRSTACACCALTAATPSRARMRRALCQPVRAHGPSQPLGWKACCACAGAGAGQPCHAVPLLLLLRFCWLAPLCRSLPPSWSPSLPALACLPTRDRAWQRRQQCCGPLPPPPSASPTWRRRPSRHVSCSAWCLPRRACSLTAELVIAFHRWRNPLAPDTAGSSASKACMACMLHPARTRARPSPATPATPHPSPLPPTHAL